jgi:hypothetical protein
VFAVRINFHYLFHPLYQDYTFVGRILGFFFRSTRIGIGAVIYAVVIIVGVALYFLWILLPLFAIYRAFNF